MHNFFTVFLFEIIRTVKKKTFWLSTLAFPLIFALLATVIYVSGKSADTATERAGKEQFTLTILDDSKLLSPAVFQALKAQPVQDREAAIQEVKEGRVDAFFYYPSDPSSQAIVIHAKDAGITKNGKYDETAKQLLQASAAARAGSPEIVKIIQGKISTATTTYADGSKTKGFERVIVPGLFLILFYIIIVLLSNQMLTSTTEEKENRVVEIILTTVAARTLIIGKIAGLVILGLIQIVAIALPLAIGYIFFRDELNIPSLNLSQLAFDPVQMLVGALLLVGGLLLFTGLLVAIGAAVPTAKEANNFFGAAMLMMFAPLYALAAIATDPEQLMVQIFSFFPLSAPVTLMVRNAAGNLTTVEAVIGLIILYVSAAAALVIAVRSFQYGAIEYSRKLSWREMIRF